MELLLAKKMNHIYFLPQKRVPAAIKRQAP